MKTRLLPLRNLAFFSEFQGLHLSSHSCVSEFSHQVHQVAPQSQSSNTNTSNMITHIRQDMCGGSHPICINPAIVKKVGVLRSGSLGRVAAGGEKSSSSNNSSSSSSSSSSSAAALQYEERREVDDLSRIGFKLWLFWPAATLTRIRINYEWEEVDRIDNSMVAEYVIGLLNNVAVEDQQASRPLADRLEYPPPIPIRLLLNMGLRLAEMTERKRSVESLTSTSNLLHCIT